jgi:tetratricopeptide (TPR) repeat protein
MGQTYALRYDYARGVTEFREAIRLEPENSLAWDLCSWALEYEQPPEPVEAEKAAREALRLEPSSSAARYHLGRALLFQSRYDEANDAFRSSGELGDSTYMDLGMGQVALALGKFDQAVTYMEGAAKVKRAAIHLFWLSAAYSAKGDKDKAFASMQESFKLGFRDFSAIDNSPYLANLRADPRYRQLAQQYRK